MVYNIFGYVSEEVCIFVDLSKIHVDFIYGDAWLNVAAY